MGARVVIGANFGDEGKGLVVDYLCSQGADIVVRHNGGAQAGHTVVTPEGRRHVFSHFGAGTMQGVPTFLGREFVCNPVLFAREYRDLTRLGVNPIVYADTECRVTTLADMLVNQRLESKRGADRHGSCGVGFGETIERTPKIPIRLRTLWDDRRAFTNRVAMADAVWVTERTGSPAEWEPQVIDQYFRDAELMAAIIRPATFAKFAGSSVVFEGAQGLLLDMNNLGMFPHVTRSRTGISNAAAMCAPFGTRISEVYYVTRTYLTRHGAGPLPGEWKGHHEHDPLLQCSTNVEHPWQGVLRGAPLDGKLAHRCFADAFSARVPQERVRIVKTHCDRFNDESLHADFEAWGPTRNDVRKLA